MWYIFDCSGKVAGNPKGYKTHRGANAQARTINSNAWHDIMSARYEDTSGTTLVYRIELIEG